MWIKSIDRRRGDERKGKERKGKERKGKEVVLHFLKTQNIYLNTLRSPTEGKK